MEYVKPPPKHTPKGAAITDLILEVFRLNGRLLTTGDRLTEDIGLTSARWQVIGAIALAEAPQPVANLARSMGLSRQAVQRTVNDLDINGLVTFATNPHHQRAKLVVLTRKGLAAYNAAGTRQAPWADQLARDLHEEELATAARVLGALTRKLEAAEVPQVKKRPARGGQVTSRRTRARTGDRNAKIG
jgi:DNA-binding MarR family transcriptional regulator